MTVITRYEISLDASLIPELPADIAAIVDGQFERHALTVSAQRRVDAERPEDALADALELMAEHVRGRTC